MENFVGVVSVKKTDKESYDEFGEEWTRAKNYWTMKHPVFDRNYLFYRGINYLEAQMAGGKTLSSYFGAQVFVPRTFQTVESLYAQLVSRDIEFSCRGKDWISTEKEKYFERMDNMEFLRSESKEVVLDTFHDALIFGNGYFSNLFNNDRKLLHVPRIETVVGDDGKQTNEIKWEEEWVTLYKGMKPKVLNPYHVFPDPYASSVEDWRFCFVYDTIDVRELRRFAIASGWMDEEEAEKKIQPGNTENFDSVRERVDLVYQKNGGTQAGTSTITDERDQGNMVGVVAMYSPDGYELRINGQQEPLYKDYNVYMHKEIPIQVIHNYKDPHEFLAQGEPEVIRWQQIEENKMHNLVLYGTLMGVVQRFTVNSSLLEDPSDASFYDPFMPIRVKAGLGGSVLNAVQALPQPDLKRSPFELMSLVKEIAQQTTGATDMLVSASGSMSNTATESNNLLAATAQRVRAKIASVEKALQDMVRQWHFCYTQFYDDEMDIEDPSETKKFFKFVPYKKAEADTNTVLIQEAAIKYNAMGKTLTDIYLNKGYKDVMFIDDFSGVHDVVATIKDSALMFNQTLDAYTKVITVLGQVNNMEQSSGGVKKFDVFKLGTEMLRLFPMISEADNFVKDNEAMKKAQEAQQGVPSQGSPLSSQSGASQEFISNNETNPEGMPESFFAGDVMKGGEEA